MFDSTGNFYYGESLHHHGVKGMKWGVRRYQNPDGSLTAKGKMLQAKKDKKEALNRLNKHNTDFENYTVRHPIKVHSPQVMKEYTQKRGVLESDFYDKQAKYKQAKKEYKATPEGKKESRKAVAKGAAVVAGLALAGVGLHAVRKYQKDLGERAYRNIINMDRAEIAANNELARRHLAQASKAYSQGNIIDGSYHMKLYGHHNDRSNYINTRLITPAMKRDEAKEILRSDLRKVKRKLKGKH